MRSMNHRPLLWRVRVIPLTLVAATLAVLLAGNLGAQLPVASSSEGKRPLELEDLLTWKSIRFPTISNDGKWIAYLHAPNEGDAEFVYRGTDAGGTETRIPVGEPPTGFGGAGGLAVSGNSRWVAFTIYANAEDARKAQRDRRTPATKVAVIELATGNRREFERVRSFRFAGDASNVIALQHMPPDAAPGAAGGGGGAASGSLLSIVDLSGGTPVTLVGVADYSFDAAGAYLAYTIDQRDQIGNSVQLREMSTGIVRALDAEKARYTRMTWADTGDALSLLRSRVDTASKDTLAAVLAWSGLSTRNPVKLVIDNTSPGVSDGLVISADRSPKWSDSQNTIYFGLREPRTALPPSTGIALTGGGGPNAPGAGSGGRVAPARQDDETPSLVLWHWKDPRLQSAQQVQENSDKSFNYLAVWHVSDGKVVKLADDKVRTVSTAFGDRWGLGADFTPYERLNNLDGRSRRDFYAIDLRTGERARIAEGINNPGGGFAQLFSPDGNKAAWYDDGHWNVYDFASKSSRRVTDGVAAVFWNDEDDRNVVKPPRSGPFAWSRDSRFLFLRDGWDIWRVNAVGSGAALNVTANGKINGIRYQARVGADPRERGIDLSRPIYIETYGERTKQEGLAQVDLQRGGSRVLSWEDAKVDYRKARNSDTWFYTRQTFTASPDWYAADVRLAGERRLTDMNPQQKDVAWSAGARLVNYKCDNDGPELQGALYLPAGYEEGKKYPTLTYIYERLSQGLNAYTQPNATRYANASVYTSRGYAYFTPDISYWLDDPGRSAVWCVVPAVKAAIATGIVDADNVGLQGHSWGGYQTSFITTQTDIFKTAIAGAPLTDMVSMFSSVYWNTGSANQPIFISSQGRFRSGYVQNPDAYIRNSPNRYAQNLNIPFMILHNDRDGAVDFNQGITYYNTLRELGKEVILLEYVGENHGLSRPTNQKDYAVRMFEWFDHFLKGEPAPEWLKEGVPRLKMEEHLRSRRSLVDPKAKKNEEPPKAMN